MSGKVYAVRVTLKGRSAIVPVRTLEGLGGAWLVGYVTPTGSHRKYNIGGGTAYSNKSAAENALLEASMKRGWLEWPVSVSEKCYTPEEFAEAFREYLRESGSQKTQRPGPLKTAGAQSSESCKYELHVKKNGDNRWNMRLESNDLKELNEARKNIKAPEEIWMIVTRDGHLVLNDRMIKEAEQA